VTRHAAIAKRCARAALIVITLAAMPGCAARRCRQALIACRYECQRQYQLCQVKGNEEYYCRNLIGNCIVQCDDAHPACSPS
jgi:hypothetical protein